MLVIFVGSMYAIGSASRDDDVLGNEILEAAFRVAMEWL